MIHDALRWESYIRTRFMPQIDTFVACIEKRVIPAFGNINEEAEKIEQEEFERLNAIGDEYGDLGDCAERATDKGITYYLDMTAAFQGLLNLFAAGLYHMFEQQILLFHRKALLLKDQENDLKSINLNKVKEILANSSIDITSFSSYPKIDELRLVANTVKHADGDSAKKLKGHCPDLFEPLLGSAFMSMFPSISATKRQVFQPLAGEDLYIKTENFKAYTKAVRIFWLELADALKKMVDASKLAL